MSNPLDQYFWLNAGAKQTIQQIRDGLKDTYSKVESDNEVKEQLDSIFKVTELLANGINIQARNAQVGQTPVSRTCPIAPELEYEDAQSIADAIAG